MALRDQKKNKNKTTAVMQVDCIYCGDPTSIIMEGVCISCRKIKQIAYKRPAVVALILATALQSRDKVKEKYKRNSLPFPL